MMTNEDLFRGLTHARTEYLQHCEREPVRRKKVLLRLSLVAILAVVLSGSVLAVRHRVRVMDARESQTNRPGIVADFHGREQAYMGLADIYLTLELSMDRPRSIMTAYVPLYFARSWSPVEQIRSASQQGQIPRTMIRLHWAQGDAYAIYTQSVVEPGLSDQVEYPVDVINTGYNEICTFSQKELADRVVYCAEVAPSELSWRGEVLRHEGYRKYYWSDGEYLFTLELSYGLSEEIAAEAIGEIQSVEDVSAYERVIYVAPEVTEPVIQEMVLYPGYIPEDWISNGVQAKPDGCYSIIWSAVGADSGMSQLCLEQIPAETQQSLIRDWETGTETVEKGICTAGAWEVKVYAREYVTEIFWNDGEVDYILSCRGRELLPVEELLAVIESLTYWDADSLK